MEEVLFINYWQLKCTNGSPLIPSCKILKDKRPENIAQNGKGRLKLDLQGNKSVDWYLCFAKRDLRKIRCWERTKSKIQ